MAEKLATDFEGDAGADRRDSVGSILAGARQKRNLTAAEAAGQAHIPLNYLAMLEANDYEKIPDQLYLLPFLRRYATFLDLDADRVGAWFVRDAVRAENAAFKSPYVPKAQGTSRNVWITTAVVVLIVIAAIYLALSGGRGTESEAPALPEASPSAPSAGISSPAASSARVVPPGAANPLSSPAATIAPRDNSTASGEQSESVRGAPPNRPSTRSEFGTRGESPHGEPETERNRAEPQD